MEHKVLMIGLILLGLLAVFILTMEGGDYETPDAPQDISKEY